MKARRSALTWSLWVEQAVRRALENLETCVLDQLRGKQGRGTDRQDLVVVAVDDEGWHVEPPEIFGEVRLREGLDAIEGSVETGLHPLEPERVPKALRNLGARPVGAVERRAEVLEELGTVGKDTGAD